MGEAHYIALDGLDGSGKSSQLKLLAQALESTGISHITMREPGATEVVGKQIREILLTGKDNKLDGISEALLFSADRRQGVLTVVRPALEAGTWVLSDRSFLTTTVYQGYGRGLSLEMLESLHRIAVEDTRPELQIILLLPVEVGLARKGKQFTDGLNESRMESLGTGFHQRVKEGYEAEAAKHDNIVLIDADADMQTVHGRIVEAVNTRFGTAIQPVTVEEGR